MATQTQIQDKFFTSIIDMLDEVNAQDWEMYIKDFKMPQNGFSQAFYNGENAISLYLNMIVRKRKTNLFATFNAISKAGGKLKKGSKSSLIQYGNFIYTHKETGKKISADQFKQIPESERSNYKKYYFLRSYNVFNFDDIENREELNMEIKEEDSLEDFQELKQAENFIITLIEKGNLKVYECMTRSASYNKVLDKVKMPIKKQFVNETAYYSTLFHELTHWTMHPTRLNRTLSYSSEELVAEIGSMLLCLQFGIHEEFINSVRYLKSWSATFINKDERAEELKKAFSDAKKSKKYMESFLN
ncbi:DUF1738 domain-containing protein [Elizabethkingia meningoseptica]|uniref:zincin-like metallopeptidase domain-containing protein n=1 Tax=Elizabethkingia meningoseptica TaxID=238 RepID=UPI0016251FAD|nr:zincin-like metallopeptidase domain-containing protein [Elizabethkingia meningoseptica]MCT3649909.1 DUF1738 domain-containing protein [Elizabethkingia anophelis]MCT3697024.1 DUF1738 domain-containing protein [Elizabethkingia anophelis]MCT3860979.1 DUF1738 domain-containing protein [Elizabethkingia anophelis]MCT3946768.1 DUF1738 domain-containing protein [Elizabethkingia anophelis]MCT3996420.1 DUF1738 domain-containing protein [Elizabethkingia anophelis]